jgi:hypothetical protein
MDVTVTQGTGVIRLRWEASAEENFDAAEDALIESLRAVALRIGRDEIRAAGASLTLTLRCAAQHVGAFAQELQCEMAQRGYAAELIVDPEVVS